MPREYPFFDERTLSDLQRVVVAAKEDPLYVTDPSCPFPQWLRGLLRAPDEEEGEVSEAGNDPAKWIARLLKDLEEVRGSDISKLEPAERNTYFRTGFGLTEKLVALEKELASVAMARAFMAKVVDALDDLVPEAIKGEFMARIKLEAEAAA